MNPETMNPELLKAFRRGNVYQINELIRGNPNLLSGKTLQGNTSLHLAARLEDKHVINMILEHKPEFLYEKNQNDETPMHVAAKAGNALAIATFATFVGYDNNRTESVEAGQENIFALRDKQRNTPLHHAIGNHHNLAAVLLINYAHQTLREMNDAYQVPLYIAIDTSSIYIAWFIIKEHPCSLDYRGPNEVTLLHCAVIRQNYDLVVEILKIRRELINTLDAHGRNPIHYAAVLGNKKIAMRLLEADADASSSSLGYNADCNDKTPLHLAAEKGQQSVFEILVNGYPDAIVKVDEKRRNILHLAALNGNVDTVRFILTLDETEYLINSPDVDGNTPLHLAAMNFHTGVVNVLSENKKVNMRATNLSQQTALAIVESSTNPGRDIKMQYLTVKILNEAITARAFCLEDILQDDRLAFYQECVEKDERQIRQHQENREMSHTLIVMATLIATFTFTAAFTLPGGYQDNGPNEGMAKLVRKSGFKMCVITITIAMTSSMAAAVLCLGQIHMGKDLSYIDVNLIQLAIPLIWLGLVSMSLAFLSGLAVVLSNNMTLATVVICIGGAFTLLLYDLAPFFAGSVRDYFKYLHKEVLLAFGDNSVHLFYYSLLDRMAGVELSYHLESVRLHLYNNQVKHCLEYGLYTRNSIPLYQLIPIVLAEIVYDRLFTRM